MIAAIMQPTFIPWLGYFDMIDKVDHFVFLDSVQLAKRSWQVRNKIKTAQGEHFVTIPITKSKSRDELLIKDALINYTTQWDTKFLKLLTHSYGKAKHFQETYAFLSDLIAQQPVCLTELTTAIIEGIAQKIGITTTFSYSSALNCAGSKDELLVNIVKELGADQYLSAQGSAVYIEQDSPGGFFTKNDLHLYYHAYEHPTYPQGKSEFISHVGIIDLLFHVGFEQALALIQSGRKEDIPYLIYRKNINS